MEEGDKHRYGTNMRNESKLIVWKMPCPASQDRASAPKLSNRMWSNQDNRGKTVSVVLHAGGRSWGRLMFGTAALKTLIVVSIGVGFLCVANGNWSAAGGALFRSE